MGKENKSRVLVLGLLLTLVVAAFGILFLTPEGKHLREHHQTYRDSIMHWVADHRIWAPVIYIAIYLLFAILALPVWILQVLAGYGFGLVPGVLWSQVGATLGSTITLQLSRWLGAEWFHNKVETKMHRLQRLDELMGHNGLLVVMGVRLMHFMPLGLSNYIFGLTRITLIDVAFGTLLGNIPVVTFWVTLGARYELLSQWRYWLILVGINLILLIPLLVRYHWPGIARKIGVE